MFYLILLADDKFSYNQSKRLHMLQIICNSRKASLKTKRWVYISASLSSYIPRGGRAQQHRGPITIHGENEACAGWQWMNVPFWE